MLRNTLKTYTPAENTTYRHTTMVRHDGTTIAFAMDSQRRIHYSVLDLSPKLAAEGEQPGGEPARGLVDKDHWLRATKLLSFPIELAKVGYREESLLALKEVVVDDERDPFRSSTARLTADAPFEVLSDGRFVYVFRQSVNKDHADAKEQGTVIVDDRILVDRFVLVDNELARKTEVRFQRSRHQTKPQGDKDSLSSTDMDGNRFYEPTQKLEFAHHVQGGRFSALLVPTSMPDRQKWQIFAHSAKTGRLECYSVERTAEGLFDTRGQELVPDDGGSDYPDTCLRFGQPDSGVMLSEVAGIRLDERSFTIELWAKRASKDGHGWMLGQGDTTSGNSKFLHIGFRDENNDFHFGFLEDDIHGPVCTDQEWHHWACVYDHENKKKIIYRDGEDVTNGGATSGAFLNGNDPLLLGRIGRPSDKESYFKGDVDELRIWTEARSKQQINADMGRRLLGDEPGLCGYWRFDEGVGVVVHDQTQHDHRGKIFGTVEWVPSAAPVGEHPGVQRRGMSFEDRSIAGGPCAQLYYQQELGPVGYDGKDKPLKHGARVMLAVPTKAKDTDPALLATVDFGVSRKGGLARVPSVLALSVLTEGGVTGGGLQQAVGDVARSEAKLRELGQRIRYLEGVGDEAGLRKKLDELEKERVTVEQELEAARNNPLNYWCILKNVDVLADRMLGIATDRSPLYAYLYFNANPTNTDLHWSFVSIGPNSYQLKNRDERFATLRLTAHDNEQAKPWVVMDDPRRVDRRATWGLSQNGQDYYLENQGVPRTHLASFKTTDYWVRVAPNDGHNSYKWRLEKAPGNEAVNDTVSNLQQRSDKLASTISHVKYLLGNITELARELERLRKEVEKEQPKLTEAKPRVKAHDRARSLSMPMVHVDPLGLSTTGGVLDFVSTVDAPAPFDGADGRLVLHCRGRAPDHPFLAARFDTSCARARYVHLTAGEERLELISRHPGSEMNAGVTIAITDGSGDGLCTVKLSSKTLGIEETWKNVSRTPELFAKTLNGSASSREEDDDYYDYNDPNDPNDPNVTATKPYDARRGSLLFTSVIPRSAKGKVKNTTVTSPTKLGQASRWVADASHHVLTFDGKQDRVVSDDHGRLTGLDHELTMEAWIQPESVTGQARIIHASASNETRYVLGVEPRFASSALSLSGNKDEYVSCGRNIVPKQHDFTIEFWTKRGSRGKLDFVIGQGEPSKNKGLQIGFRGNDEFWFDFHQDAIAVEASHTDLEWHHWACVFVQEGRKGTIYRDGVLMKTSRTSFTGDYTGQGNLWIGQAPHAGEFYKGAVDELRIWNHARTIKEIQATWFRTLERQEIDPTKLLGYWHSGEGYLLDHSGHERHGEFSGKPARAASPVRKGFVFFAGHGSTVVATDHAEALEPPGSHKGWVAASAVFQQSYALEFDGKERYLDCGKGQALDIRDDLTLEATLQLADVSQDLALLAKGHLNDGGDHGVPYSLYVERGGKLVFASEDVDGRRQRFRSETALAPGRCHRVAFTRKRETNTSDKGKVDTWTTLSFYVDGTPAGSSQHPGGDVRGNDQSLELGRGRSWDGRVLGFKGVLMDVRLWSVARTEAELAGGLALSGREKGLVSWWRLEDASGRRALDAVGDHHGELVGSPRWVKNPDPTGSTFEIHVNGAARKVAPLQGFQWGDEEGFSLGSRVGTEAKALFDGAMDEVRIWRGRRTPEQLQDTVFTRLTGKHDGLHAYYTFHHEDGQKVKDRSGNEHHLQLDRAPEPGRYRLSTAPVGEDAPQVRGALGGVPTAYQVAIESRPAAGEYGVMQRGADGQPTGALKRCYTCVSGGQWHLPTGFKSGDLIAEWIGQLQYDPQLIGFIEGAPPVPSENLTRKDDYGGASRIELKQGDGLKHTYATNSDEGFDSAIEGSVFGGLKASSKAGVPPVMVEAVSNEQKISGKFSFKHSNSWLAGAVRAEGRTTGKLSAMALGGYREQSGTGPGGGRRFIPDNVGFALVQSDTADLFSLRLASNGSFVAYSMALNPDIPRDWNIITFPLNPKYVKQGTLKSYDKKDVTRLKQRIEREEQRLSDEYDQLALGAFGVPRTLPNVAKRNIANTYVWTADGGFFAETQETLDVVQETRGGSYAIGFMAGASFDFSLYIGTFGGGFSLSAMVGAHFNVTTTKSREEEHALSLEVALDVERDLYKYDANDKLVYGEDGRPIRQKDKVDGYRFTTFYLQPAIEHFDAFANEVVDPTWLAEDPSEAAENLRKAINAQRAAGDTDKAKPWRVLHRVTHVHKVE